MLLKQLLETKQILNEKLGNLAKLGMPKLVQSLKQEKVTPTNTTPMPSPGASNKFKTNYWDTNLGHDSEIIDGGLIKNGLPDIKRLYKKHERVGAFALYVDDKPVAFGKYDAEELAGPTRSGILSYDLNEFKAQLDVIEDERNAKLSDWERRNHKKSIERTTTSSIEVQKYDYNQKSGYKTYIEHRVGKVSTTANLKTFIEMLLTLGKVSVKLVCYETIDKKRDRQNNRPQQRIISNDDLRTFRSLLMARLKKHKLSKKPSVDNIMDFLKAAEKGTGIIQFAGSSYSLQKKDGYGSLTPLQILQGKIFEIRYDSVDDNFTYITIQYSFEKESSLLMPISVKWTDVNDGKTPKEEVLNVPVWLKKAGINKDDKTSSIKSLLTSFKDGKYRDVEKQIAALRKAGADWPELKTIEKSLEAEKNKPKED